MPQKGQDTVTLFTDGIKEKVLLRQQQHPARPHPEIFHRHGQAGKLPPACWAQGFTILGWHLAAPGLETRTSLSSFPQIILLGPFFNLKIRYSL